MENSGMNNEYLPSDIVIVIGRQFGSGGRRIGQKIAEKLGIDYYDTELLSKAAERLGMHPEIFREHDERRPSPLRTLMQGAFGIADNFHSVPLNGEMIYEEQSRVIRDLCNNGACVIVGRTADLILKSHPHLLSVFLHSPVEKRAKIIIDREEAVSEEEAKELALKRDRRREVYYNFYRGDKKWGEANNYHLTINTEDMDVNDVADLIITTAKIKFRQK